MMLRMWIRVVLSCAVILHMGCQQTPRSREGVRRAGIAPPSAAVTPQGTASNHAILDPQVTPVSFDPQASDSEPSDHRVSVGVPPSPQDIVAPPAARRDDSEPNGDATGDRNSDANARVNDDLNGGAPFLEELPAPRGVDVNQTLQLADVVESVHQSYPLLRIAFLERGVADGNQLAAWGEFDTGVKVFGIETPQGYYENYRQGRCRDSARLSRWLRVWWLQNRSG